MLAAGIEKKAKKATRSLVSTTSAVLGQAKFLEIYPLKWGDQQMC